MNESLGSVGLNEVVQAEGLGELIFWVRRKGMGSTGLEGPKCVSADPRSLVLVSTYRAELITKLWSFSLGN